MKIFISVDIEGVTGIHEWKQATKGEAVYEKIARRMSEEVAAAIKGAKRAGAKEIVVRDAHGTADNLDIELLDESITLIQKFNHHPDLMMYGIDESFDAAMFIGYHAGAYQGGNPLAHTLSSSKVHKLTVNGNLASEYLLNAYIAAEKGVPVVFMSGDKTLGEHAKNHQKDLYFVETFDAEAETVIYKHPKRIQNAITETVEKALKSMPPAIETPKRYKIKVEYKNHSQASMSSFYPGAKLIDLHTVEFESKDIEKVKAFLVFTT